jgi:hypothetical protein
MEDRALTEESVVSQADGLVATDIDGETVMMSVEHGRYYGFDLVGSRVWELISEPIKVSSLVDALLTEYDVDRDRCQKGVIAVLQAMLEEKVIELSPVK